MKLLRQLPPLAAMLLTSAALVAGGCELAVRNLTAASTEVWQRTYEGAAVSRIDLVNVNGTIDVEPSDDGRIGVDAEKSVRAATDQAARDLLARIEIVDQVTDGQLQIKTNMPKLTTFFGGGHTEVRYQLRVPPTTAVEVSTTNGRIRVHGVQGGVTASTINGGVSGADLGGGVKASTVNGEIDLELKTLATSGVSAETVNGHIEVRLPDAAGADLRARCVNGSISTGELSVDASQKSRRVLEGRINGGGPRIDVSTTNGGISIRGS